jgi:hypothetical protein
MRNLRDAKDGCGLAFWFAGLNSFLDDEGPHEVLATDPKRVIAAAKDEMADLRRKDRMPQFRGPRSRDILPADRGLEGRGRGFEPRRPRH